MCLGFIIIRVRLLDVGGVVFRRKFRFLVYFRGFGREFLDLVIFIGRIILGFGRNVCIRFCGM